MNLVSMFSGSSQFPGLSEDVDVEQAELTGASMALLSRASYSGRSWTGVLMKAQHNYLMPAIHHLPLAELLVPTSGNWRWF